MGLALLALGLVLVLEGLIWALFPKAVEDMLEALRALPVETRRVIGLGAAALGLALIWWADLVGAAF